MLTRITPALADAYWASTHSAQLGAQDPHPVAAPQTRGDKGAGETVDSLVELRVRPPDALMTHNQRLTIGMRRNRALEVGPIVSPSSDVVAVPCA
jgi:hypothetical protein